MTKHFYYHAFVVRAFDIDATERSNTSSLVFILVTSHKQMEPSRVPVAYRLASILLLLLLLLLLPAVRRFILYLCW